jgi:hypothetical protein
MGSVASASAVALVSVADVVSAGVAVLPAESGLGTDLEESAAATVVSAGLLVEQPAARTDAATTVKKATAAKRVVILDVELEMSSTGRRIMTVLTCL